MRWELPRELLWAVIGTLAIFVIVLWPSQYPYGQAPNVQPQHQTENGVSGSDPSEHSPSPQINPSSEQQREHGGEHASDVTFLGIKPGEWLLSIITLMLWGATVRLVRSAEETSAEQSRDMKASIAIAKKGAEAALKSADALVSAERANMFVSVDETNIPDIVDGISANAPREDELSTPRIGYSFKNFGKTHATVKEVAAQLVLAPELSLDGQPHPRIIKEPIVASQGVTEPFGCLMNDTLTIGGARDFKERKSDFWLDGYIVFEDAFGITRQYDFTLQFRSNEGGFRLQRQYEDIYESPDNDWEDDIPF